MNLVEKFGTVVASAFAVSGCATLDQSPCAGATVIPHTAYNRDMTEFAAGVQRRPSRGNTYSGNYGGFGYPLSYRFGLNAENKPSEVVYTVTSVRGVTSDIKIDNNSSTMWRDGLTLLAAAVGTQIGGSQVANALIFGAAGNVGGSEIDRNRNAAQANKINSCVRYVIAGHMDNVIPAPIPQGSRAIPPQSEGQGGFIHPYPQRR